MPALLKFSRMLAGLIDSLNERVGRLVSWLTLAMVVVTFSIVVLRYALNAGWIAMQESVGYMHALVFMLGVAYTLKHDGHVRVDILYQRLGIKGRAWIDFFGTLFLLFPVAGYILWSSWEYVGDSWEIRESSGSPGGLPGVYLVKTSILLMAFLLILQGISLALTSLMAALGFSRNGEPE
ncbi:MAG: TRAP transporter small permease subunit [Gammaproteobacteria bacterium]